MRNDCTSNAPCRFGGDRYELADSDYAVVRGLQLTLTGEWTSPENDGGELALSPADNPDDKLFIWRDLVAVKSSGPGHGKTVLRSVGRSPKALVPWLTSNDDLEVVSKPVPVTIGRGIKMVSLGIGVSDSANYDDPGCPSDPKCADLFTDPKHWRGEFYGIGGDEEVQLYLGTLTSHGQTHTFLVSLDAPNHAALERSSSRPSQSSKAIDCHPVRQGPDHARVGRQWVLKDET
jgi:hypothetical protein